MAIDIKTVGTSMEVNYDTETKEVFFVNCDTGEEFWLTDLEEAVAVAEALNLIVEDNKE